MKRHWHFKMNSAKEQKGKTRGQFLSLSGSEDGGGLSSRLSEEVKTEWKWERPQDQANIQKGARILGPQAWRLHLITPQRLLYLPCFSFFFFLFERAQVGETQVEGDRGSKAGSVL